MESGLEGRNNVTIRGGKAPAKPNVSMESGLEGRNNATVIISVAASNSVSMESGLEGRNNEDGSL